MQTHVCSGLHLDNVPPCSFSHPCLCVIIYLYYRRYSRCSWRLTSWHPQWFVPWTNAPSARVSQGFPGWKEKSAHLQNTEISADRRTHKQNEQEGVCSHLLRAVEASRVCQGVVSCVQSWSCCESTTYERKRFTYVCNRWGNTESALLQAQNGKKWHIVGKKILSFSGKKKNCLWWWTEGGLRECSQEWPYLSPLPLLSLIGSGLMNDGRSGGGVRTGEGWTEPARKAVQACRMWGRQEAAVCELLKSGVRWRRRER